MSKKLFHINDNVLDNLDGKDFFNGKNYSNDIVNAINSSEITSVGLYGKWGVGKTSIVNDAITKLKKNNKYNDKNIIIYNAWKYSKTDFMRDFLYECSKKIENKEQAEARAASYYSNETDQIESQNLYNKSLFGLIKRNKKFIIFSCLIYVLFVSIILFINYKYPAWFDAGDILIPLTTIFISIFLPLVITSNIKIKTVDRKFSPEQFERDFKEIIGKKKVLIFIDDIDRCEVREMKETLDTLKTFILDNRESGYKVKFIVSVDPNVMIEELDGKVNDYFSKIFNHVIDIKDYVKFDYNKIKAEVLNYVEDEYMQEASDGLDLATDYYVDTPRKLKSFSNEFINELYNHNSPQIKGKGSLFAKLIILKNEYKGFYNILTSDYKKEKNKLQQYIESYENDETMELDGLFSNLKLLRFLSETKEISLDDYSLYSRGITYEQYALENLLSNPIPKNILKKDTAYEWDKNFSFIKNLFKKNIINPIAAGKIYLPGNKFNKLMFLISELNLVLNTENITQLKKDIIAIWNKITDDSELKIVVEDEETFNSKYFFDSIKSYFNTLNGNDVKLQNDLLVIEILNELKLIVLNDDEEQEQKLEDFLNIFKNEKIINKELMTFIDKFLLNDFNKNLQRIPWYFDNCISLSDKNIFSELVDYENQKGFSEEEKLKVSNYIECRYSSMNDHKILFQKIVSKLDILLADTSKYEFIINSVTKVIKLSKIEFNDVKSIFPKLITKLDAECITKLYFMLIETSPETENFSNEELLEIRRREYKKVNDMSLSFDIIQKNYHKFNQKNLEIALGYNEELKIYENYNIIKNIYPLFSKENQTEETFVALTKTIINNKGFVTDEELGNQGFSISKYFSKIKEFIEEDINSLIYLLNKAKEKDIGEISFANVEIEKIELNRIKNSKVLIKITEILKTNIKNISEDIIQEIDTSRISLLMDKLIIMIKILYLQLNCDYRFLWSILKEVEPKIMHMGIQETVYYNKFKADFDLRKIIKERKYKSSYDGKSALSLDVIKIVDSLD